MDGRKPAIGWRMSSPWMDVEWNLDGQNQTIHFPLANRLARRNLAP